MSDIRFDDRVAIITGAGAGLGRSHALELARRGAKIVVNDLGGAMDGTGASATAAEAVAAEIREAGGDAVAHGADVTQPNDVADMVEQTLKTWGRANSSPGVEAGTRKAVMPRVPRSRSVEANTM